MTAVLNHEVRLHQAPTVDAERRSNWAQWICSCGVRSRLFATAELADKAGRSHANAHRQITPAEEDDRWLWDDARYERRMDM